MREGDGGLRSVAEIQAALEEFGSDDLGRLERAARQLSVGTGMGPDDLLQEAIRRALEGERTCPCEVEISVFLYNVMKSIASASRKQISRRPRHESLDEDENAEPASRVASRERSVEELLVARADYSEHLKALQALFDDDEQALLVVMGDLDGESATVLKDMGAMDDKVLATVRRRIRRKIEKAFPEGWKP